MIANALDMTQRQLVILGLVADGETDAEIARALKIRESTARAHVANVRDRLLIQYPQLKNGNRRPRVVILRYFRFVDREAFGRKEKEGAKP